ncbi:MAG TPA: dihydrodipicolinate synthase family protein [Devosiaceae bacterium]|jgi:4-hydroxy-tetrahydrodipicolinate synthase
MTIKLAGAFPVLPTPFRADGSIDTDDFRSIIDFVLESKVDGVVYPGVASEVETLTADERRSQIVLLADRIAGRIPIILGASDPDPAGAALHVAQAAEIGAGAAMVIAPGSAGNDVGAQVGYFNQVADGASVPIMLQNQPKPIGAGLTPEEVAAVANAVPAIRYIKEETLPPGQHLTRIKAALESPVDAIFGGAGGRYVTDELARGAAGTMPAAELADIHAQLVHAFGEGDIATARRLYSVSLPLLNFQAIFRMHMTKEVLRRRGVIKNTFVRAKGPRPDAGDYAELALLLADAQLPYTNHRPV